MTLYKKLESNNISLFIYEDEFNKRVRVDTYYGPPGEVIKLIDQYLPPWTEKLIAKIFTADISHFIGHGYKLEAFIGGYFNGEDMHFLVKYLNPGRGVSETILDNEKILNDILSSGHSEKVEKALVVKVATVENCSGLAELFAEVFEVYPVPLHTPDDVKRSMEKGTVFVFIEENGRILSAASAEINDQYKNAELTDCATLSIARGKGHMQQLILKLEELLNEKGIHYIYTIARSRSFGINKAFYNLGYTYGGRLINNCYICSGLEDMNVWYKVRR